MKHDDKVSSLITELIVALPGYFPLEKPTATDGEQRFALMQMYKEKGYREYLERAIRTLVASFQHIDSERALYMLQGKVEVLKELYRISKQMFEDGEKIDSRIKPE